MDSVSTICLWIPCQPSDYGLLRTDLILDGRVGSGLLFAGLSVASDEMARARGDNDTRHLSHQVAHLKKEVQELKSQLEVARREKDAAAEMAQRDVTSALQLANEESLKAAGGREVAQVLAIQVRVSLLLCGRFCACGFTCKRTCNSGHTGNSVLLSQGAYPQPAYCGTRLLASWHNYVQTSLSVSGRFSQRLHLQNCVSSLSKGSLFLLSFSCADEDPSTEPPRGQRAPR